MASTSRSQFAIMALDEDQASGDFGSDHPQSDQYLLVLSGKGIARSDSGEQKLSSGDVILIPAGERHQIIGDKGGLKSLNFYAPVAYPDEA